jgi:steroid delta-isomerase
VAASRETIRETINDYVHHVATGTIDDILSLFAEGATVEDPVGSEVRTTRESIREFYSALVGLEHRATTLGTVRIAGEGQAAFSFELVIKLGDARYSVSPIDVMTFDDEGRITSMRAFWGKEDMTAV